MWQKERQLVVLFSLVSSADDVCCFNFIQNLWQRAVVARCFIYFVLAEIIIYVRRQGRATGKLKGATPKSDA
jgi:hypothetical protein